MYEDKEVTNCQMCRSDTCDSCHDLSECVHILNLSQIRNQIGARAN